ncbi:MAG: choice-of-anchor D domain-containing protein [Terriglobales bacterium]|jgi:kumamolisin
MIRRLGPFLLAVAAMMSVVNVVCQAEPQPLLTRHVREVVVNGRAQSIARLPERQTLHFDIVLALRHQPELENFLQELYDPSSASYRHFVTVPEFTARFGPSQEDYDALIGFAKANGFTVVGGSRDAFDVQLTGTVANINRAFHVTMGVYQHPREDRTFYAPDREPTVDLSTRLWHISGLDNYSIPRPALVHRDLKVRSNATTGSCPKTSFCGSDMRAAYYGGTTLTGAGQYLGLLEYAGYDIADLNTYYKNTGQTLNVPIQGISTDGTPLKCIYPTCDDTEQTIDMTQAAGMAPDLKTLYVYVGSSDTALLAAMSTDTPLPAQLSSSWTWEPSDPSTDDPYFEKMAGQGQNYFQAAGDDGYYTVDSQYVWPADSAYVTVVGGTDLETKSAGGPWSSETAWVDGGGGYYTPDAIPIPAWQQLSGVITKANKGSTTLRNSPDVSANANFTFYVCADQTTCTANVYGGTSFAAPMWAAYMALVNEQAVANGNPVLGFINPAIYNIGVSSSYDTDFHDITSGSNGLPAVTGYDDATGWGSPNGSALIAALAGSGSGGPVVSLSPTSLKWGNIVVGVTTAAKTVKVTNTGASTLNISSIAVSGDFAQVVVAKSCGSTLAAGKSCKIEVTFTPTQVGARTGDITITDNASDSPQTVPLSGTGAAEATLTPASKTFPTEKVGTSSRPAEVFTLHNEQSVALDSIVISTTGNFSVSAKTCTTSLAAKTSCTISVVFTPTKTGTRTGTLKVADSAIGSPETSNLTGTGK